MSVKSNANIIIALENLDKLIELNKEIELLESWVMDKVFSDSGYQLLQDLLEKVK